MSRTVGWARRNPLEGTSRLQRGLAQLDVDVFAPRRVVEVHDPGDDYRDALAEGVFDTSGCVRAHHAEDGDDPGQLADRCAEGGPEPDGPAAQIWRNRLAEDLA